MVFEVLPLAVHVGDQQRLAVAAERVLEQVGQLGLAVGRVRAALGGEGDDDLLEVGERLVDEHRLGAQLAHRLRLLQPLRAREVDQVELAPRDDARRVDARAHPQVDREDGVAARRVAVELVVGDLPVGLALEEQRERLLLRRHRLVAQVLHVAVAALVLDERERLRGGRAVGSVEREVDELVLVNFHIRDADRRLVLRVVRHVREDVRDRTRRDAAVLERLNRANLREGLARAGLAVAHDGPVEATQNRLHDRRHALHVHCLLRRVVQHSVVLPAPESCAFGTSARGIRTVTWLSSTTCCPPRSAPSAACARTRSPRRRPSRTATAEGSRPGVGGCASALLLGTESERAVLSCPL